nr:immunoglobulin heavy chain junction region [Mus musculus]
CARYPFYYSYFDYW